jgi:hypothetical protein
MAIVYLHKRLDNDEIFYVGIGRDESRAHQKKSRSIHWKNIVKKHGYKVIISHFDIIWEEACVIEKYLIDFYGRIDLNNGTLCNLTEGGDGIYGYRFTEAQKQNVSKSMKGRVISESDRLNLSKANKGKKPSENCIKAIIFKKTGVKQSNETIEKRRQSNLGRKFTDEVKIKFSKSKMGEKNPFYGKKHSKEFNIENGQRIKLALSNEETKKKHVDGIRRAMHDKEFLKRRGLAISAAVKLKKEKIALTT